MDKGEDLSVRVRTQEKGSIAYKKFRSKSMRRKSNKTCCYCKKPEHNIPDYFNFKKKQEKEEKRNFNNPPKLLILKPILTILDYGRNFHMCPYKDLFITFEHVDNSVVLMGNDAQCKVVGICTVHIKTRDDVIRTLANVHYIPYFK
ncbi:hypothetical protein Lal_00024290 [Lupinus albus]|nr:hypothetical protein Lal_00024290 [Lupinus albus]